MREFSFSELEYLDWQHEAVRDREMHPATLDGKVRMTDLRPLSRPRKTSAIDDAVQFVCQKHGIKLPEVEEGI